MRKLGFLIVMSFALVHFMGTADAYGPPPQAPIVSCTEMKLDPPPVSWIKVTMFGSVENVPFLQSTKYGSPVPHWAIIPVNFHGTVHVKMRGKWTLGPGETAETDVILHCPETSLTSTTAGPSSGGGLSSLPFTGGPITMTVEGGTGMVLLGTALRTRRAGR